MFVRFLGSCPLPSKEILALCILFLSVSCVCLHVFMGICMRFQITTQSSLAPVGHSKLLVLNLVCVCV